MVTSFPAVVEAAVAANKEAAKSYSKEEWHRQKPIIDQLYRIERRSTGFVQKALQERGFHVNERMIKTRIKEWKLDRKHKEVDMRTAIALLANDRSRSWSTYSPRFRIRGRIVTYPEILQYFRRKKITDPLVWIKTLRDDAFVASPDVELLGPESDGIADDLPDLPDLPEEDEAEEMVIDQITPYIPPSRRATFVDIGRASSSQLINSPGSWEPSLPASSIIHPYRYLPGDRVIWVMREYIDSYWGSPRASFHKEPPVHRWTTHADFAQRMHTGMFLAKKGDMSTAFGHYNMAFDMLRKMFLNDHPMSIAMLMSVICELHKNGQQAIIAQLITLAKNMATVQHGPFHQLTSMFDVLEGSNSDAADLAISSMKVALDHLRKTAGPLFWKTLYVKERLCDALYDLGRTEECAALRSHLLEEQETSYGRHARNVLWTLTNVADDDLQRGDIDSAEKRFTDALDRANGLEGYESEMGRFKAFVGLAKTAVARGDSFAPELGGLRRSKMREALRFYEKAEKEASTSSWFDGQRRSSVSESSAALRLRLDRERAPNRSASNGSMISIAE